MFKAKCVSTGEIATVYAVEGSLFLVGSGENFRWEEKDDYAPVADERPDGEPVQEAGAVAPVPEVGAVLTMRHTTSFSLAAFLDGLKAGEIIPAIGDSFTTRLKSGQEVDFVLTDKDSRSYRFESRDCLGRYDPMTKIQRFYDWALRELPDVLRDQLMEVVRPYKTANGMIQEYTSKLFLPSAAEMFPSDECYGDQGLYTQLEWYKDVHNRVRAYEKGGTPDWYWTQSPRSGNATGFCYVYTNGYASSRDASDTHVAAPLCFRIPII